MKAVVMHAPFDVRIEDVPTPEPGDGEALVRILKVGICGGDLHYYDGTSPSAVFPSIHGHEMVGVVEALNGESQLDIGDLVTGEILLPCGTCFACRHGKPNCCANLRVIGANATGAYAEYAVYPIRNLHPVPQGLSPDDAVLVEPYSIGYHVSHRAPVPPGETALVIGCGTIGLTIIDVLSSMQVRVIACDLSERRLDAARRFGAAACICSTSEDAVSRVHALTAGEGAALVCEATGNNAVMSQTPSFAAAGASIVLAGITGDTVLLDGLAVTKKELSIFGSRNAAGEFGHVLKLMQHGMLHHRALITKRFPLEEAAQAFAYLHQNQTRELKTVLELN